MELGLSGKVALVTGASRGIGKGIALSLAVEGCDLLITGRDEAALKAVAAEIKAKGRKAAISVLDLRQEGSEKPLVEAVRREFGRLDILVNNAGATQRGDFFKLTNAEWADGFALKFFAHVRLTREAWPLLKAKHGSLVTIAGIGGKEPEAPFTIGSSVNAACVAFTKAMADIGKADGVQVNSINPGRVETERLWRRFRETMKATLAIEASTPRRERRTTLNMEAPRRSRVKLPSPGAGSRPRAAASIGAAPQAHIRAGTRAGGRPLRATARPPPPA